MKSNMLTRSWVFQAIAAPFGLLLTLAHKVAGNSNHTNETIGIRALGARNNGCSEEDAECQYNDGYDNGSNDVSLAKCRTLQSASCTIINQALAGNTTTSIANAESLNDNFKSIYLAVCPEKPLSFFNNSHSICNASVPNAAASQAMPNAGSVLLLGVAASYAMGKLRA